MNKTEEEFSRSSTPVGTAQKIFSKPGVNEDQSDGLSMNLPDTDSPLILITPKQATIVAGMSRVPTYNSFYGHQSTRQDSSRLVVHFHL